MQYESNRAALESGEGMKAIEVSVALSAVLFTSFLCYGGKGVRTFRGEISDSQRAMNVHALTRSRQEMLKSKSMGGLPRRAPFTALRTLEDTSYLRRDSTSISWTIRILRPSSWDRRSSPPGAWTRRTTQSKWLQSNLSKTLASKPLR